MQTESLALSNDRQVRLIRGVVTTAALFLVVLGFSMAVMFLGVSQWIEIRVPVFFYLKFNTSLAFSVGGIALLYTLKESRQGMMAAGSFVLLVACITLTEYMTNSSLGLDRWFLRDMYDPNYPYEKNMTRGMSIAFICTGTYLLLAAGSHWQSSLRLLVMELLGFTVFALGIEGLIGHLQSDTYAYALANYVNMPPQAAIGCAALGIGLMFLTWYRHSVYVDRIKYWLPAFIGFLAIMLDLSAPPGIAADIAYMPLVFCSLLFARPNTAFVFAAIATAIGAVSNIIQAPAIVDWIEEINRIIIMGSTWLVAVWVYISRKNQALVIQGENRLRAVIENAVDGLISFRENGVIEYFNPASERIFGYKAADVVGQNIKMLIPDINKNEPGKKNNEAHLTSSGEASAKRYNETLFPIDLSISSFQLEDGRHYSAVVRDISERKRAEEATWRLAAVVESSGDAIITRTLDGIITSWNAGAQQIFGYKAEEMIGQPILNLIPKEMHKEEMKIGRQIKRGKRVEHYESLGVDKNGKNINISLAASPIFDAKGNIIGASKIIRDITERKIAEANLLRYNKELERSNQELDDFAYIASHDLKEPLRGLFNNAKFLQKDYNDKLDAEGVGRLARLGYLSQRMETLVNDLLYFSRLGRQELAIQPTDLNAVIHDIESMMETTLKEKNAVILIPHPLPVVTCDKPRITEVFRNLITNAIKYNDKPQKTVEIGYIEKMETKNGIEEQVFYVRDNGIGIEKEFFEEIFRIFKRLNEEDDDKKGTGVGLTFVRKIIDRHGGSIWVESEFGKNTTFYFTLKQGGAYATV